MDISDIKFIRAMSSNGIIPENLAKKVLENENLEAKDEEGTTILHHIAAKGAVMDLQRIVDMGCDLAAEDIFSQNALHFAVSGKRNNNVAFLLENMPGLTRVDQDNQSPLHLACMKDFDDIVKMLILHEVFADHQKAHDLYGRTPMDIARENGAQRSFAILAPSLPFSKSATMLDLR